MSYRIEQIQKENGDFYSYKISELENGGFRRVLHSVGDAPAVHTERIQEWYCDGKRHRDSGPARKGSIFAQPTNFWMDVNEYWKDGEQVTSLTDKRKEETS